MQVYNQCNTKNPPQAYGVGWDSCWAKLSTLELSWNCSESLTQRPLNCSATCPTSQGIRLIPITSAHPRAPGLETLNTSLNTGI
jgi:hypothetical protein